MSDLYSCKIIKKNIHSDYIDFWLTQPELAKACSPGQFLHVDCCSKTTLRRPISVCETKENAVRIVFQIKGEGTALLAQKNEGDLISVLGPLGHGFELCDKKTLLIGGGLGTFPLLQSAKILGENSVAILGFRNSQAVYLKEDFEKYCKDVFITTDDGSLGKKGFVTDVLKEVIADFDLVLTCGPDIMMKNIAEICIKNNVPCQVSLEERMGCGTGVCLCCTRPIMRNNEEHNLCVCKDGPVFNAKEVYFK